MLRCSALAVVLIACGSSPSDDPLVDAGGQDAGQPRDAAEPDLDAQVLEDASATDAGGELDAGPADGGQPDLWTEPRTTCGDPRNSPSSQHWCANPPNVIADRGCVHVFTEAPGVAEWIGSAADIDAANTMLEVEYPAGETRTYACSSDAAPDQATPRVCDLPLARPCELAADPTTYPDYPRAGSAELCDAAATRGTIWTLTLWPLTSCPG